MLMLVFCIQLIIQFSANKIFLLFCYVYAPIDVSHAPHLHKQHEDFLVLNFLLTSLANATVVYGL